MGRLVNCTEGRDEKRRIGLERGVLDAVVFLKHRIPDIIDVRLGAGVSNRSREYASASVWIL